MSKQLLFLIFVLIGHSLTLYGQTQKDWVLANLGSQGLTFFMHKDSIEDLYEIKDAFVIDNKDTIMFADSVLFFNISYYYPHKFKSYLLYRSKADSGLYITLDFFNDRLFRVNILTTQTNYSNNLKSEIRKYSKKQDSAKSNTGFSMYGEIQTPFILSLSKKPIHFSYHEYLNENFSSFYLEDKKFENLIPSWCGVGRSRKTWKRLEKYVARQVD